MNYPVEGFHTPIHFNNTQNNKEIDVFSVKDTETRNEFPENNKSLNEINTLFNKLLTASTKENFNQFFKTLDYKVQQLKNERGDKYTQDYLNKMKPYIKQLLEIEIAGKKLANSKDLEGSVDGIHHLLVAALISNREKDKEKKLPEEIWKKITKRGDTTRSFNK